jgi:hypothetical protein
MATLIPDLSTLCTLSFVFGAIIKAYDEICDTEIEVSTETKLVLQISMVGVCTFLMQRAELLVGLGFLASFFLLTDKFYLKSCESKNLDDPFFVVFNDIILCVFALYCLFAPSFVRSGLSWQLVKAIGVCSLAMMAECKLYNEEYSGAKLWSRLTAFTIMVTIIVLVHVYALDPIPLLPINLFGLGYLCVWFCFKMAFSGSSVVRFRVTDMKESLGKVKHYLWGFFP